MNTSPSQPESTSHALETPAPPSHAVQVQQSSAPPPIERQPPPSQLSWGEYLLPFLFAAMETCWIDAILVGLVSSNVLGLSQPLIPLWTPFVLIAGFYYLSRYLIGRGIATSNNASSSARPIIIALAALATCTVVWASVYSSRIFLLDPGWVLNLPNALAQVNAESFQILTTAIIAYMLCRRGMQLAQNRINPRQVSRVIRFGAIIIVALIVVRTIAENFGKTFSDGSLILLLIALFFCLSLIAHALSRVAFVRYLHPTGLTGSVSNQERVIMQVILVTSMAFLLLALIINSIFVGNIFTSLLEWLAQSLQVLVDFLKAPGRFRPVPPPTPCHPGINCPHATAKPAAHPTVNGVPFPSFHLGNQLFSYLPAPLVAILTIILVAMLIAAVIFVLLVISRRWLKRRNQHIRETHESVWSWTLFWSQCKDFLRAVQLRVFTRFRWLHAQHSGALVSTEGEYVAPTASTIREIYRTVLLDAEKLGHPRSHAETPYEFGSRLAQQLPFVEPQLSLITEAYTFTRYSGIILDEVEVTHLRDLLLTLEQKGLK